MREEDDMIANTARTWVVTGALALGAVIGAAGIANAATGSSGSTTPAAPVFAANGLSGPPPPGAGNPEMVSHGPGEALLSGSTASRVKAAALAAVPGTKVIRVETDSAGAAYEAHLQRSDGSYVTVKLDKGLEVTATQSGFGGGPAR
jgi:hypothetical protein